MKRRHYTLSAALCLFLALLAYSLTEPYLLTVREEEWVDSDVPAAWDGKSIVFLSDIHHGPLLARGRVRQLVDRVHALRPDLILLGGDYVYQSRQYIEPVFEELARLQAPLGKFGVLGNHDHWMGAAATYNHMLRAGIRPLDNRAQWLEEGGQRIKIAGVGDLRQDRQDLGPALDGTAPEDLVILLSHNPDYAEGITDPRIDLVLSGHTHGGQVTWFGRWAPFVPSLYGQKYRTGRVATGVTTVIISNGIGTNWPPLRFGAPPQIVRIRLVRAAP